MKLKTVPILRYVMPNGVVITLRNVVLSLWKIDGKWEEAWPSKALHRLEKAIEKKLPGWFHQFNKDGKHRKNCISCRRYGTSKERRKQLTKQEKMLCSRHETENANRSMEISP